MMLNQQDPLLGDGETSKFDFEVRMEEMKGEIGIGGKGSKEIRLGLREVRVEERREENRILPKIESWDTWGAEACGNKVESRFLN